jgi:hypothetical protein
MSATKVFYLLLPDILDLFLRQDELPTITTLALVSHASLHIYKTTVAEHMHVLKQLHHMIHVDMNKSFSFHYKGFDMHLTCKQLPHSGTIYVNHTHYDIRITPHVIAEEPSTHLLEIADMYYIGHMMHSNSVFPDDWKYDPYMGLRSRTYQLVSDAKSWGSNTDAVFGGLTIVSGIWNRNGLLTLRLGETDKPLLYFKQSPNTVLPSVRPGRLQMAEKTK